MHVCGVVGIVCAGVKGQAMAGVCYVYTHCLLQLLPDIKRLPGGPVSQRGQPSFYRNSHLKTERVRSQVHMASDQQLHKHTTQHSSR